MEEDITTLEEIIKDFDTHTNVYDEGFTIIYEKQINAIENLLTRYKQIEEKLEIKKNTPEWEYQYWEARKEVDNEWKSKVKEKIEELEECVKRLSNDGMELTYKESAEAQIEVLQDLLREE